MENNEVSIGQLFNSLRRHLILILAITVLFGAASFLFTRFMITPKYTSTAKMIAISNQARTNDIYTSAEHTAAVALVNTTAEIIKTESILNEASERLSKQGLNYSVESLKKMISISAENETEVFRLIVSGTRKNDVAMIANTIADVANERVSEITGAGGTKLLESAVTPTSQSSPNVMRNTVLGALVGFVLIALFVILRDLYDTTIWTEDDLTNHYKYPVLGLIPQLSDEEMGEKAKEA